MKYILYLLIGYSTIFSFSSNVKITLSNNSSSVKVPLIAGVDSLTTDGWDKLLGEDSFPTIFPMNTFAAYLETTDSSQTDSNGSKFYDLLWLDKDLKAVPENEVKFYRRYLVVFNWGLASKISVNWDSNLNDGIDSAFVIDALEGLVFKHKMDEVSSFEITNSGIRKFFIDIYFNKDKFKSISDNIELDKNVLFPNPASDFLYWNESENIKTITIYSMLGEVIVSNIKIYDNNRLDISFLKNGNYIFVADYFNGKIDNKVFTVFK